MRYIKQVILIVICATFVLAQSGNEKVKKYTQTSKQSDFILISGKPGVYISFERIGKRTPPGDDVSDNAVWLKLHNNMRSSISFCAYSLADKQGNMLTYEEAGEMGINYEVELTNISKLSGKKAEIPFGNNSGDFCHVNVLNKGKSVLFNIPAEHLLKGLSIRIPFNYEWEEVTLNNPTHFVYFNSLSLPK